MSAELLSQLLNDRQILETQGRLVITESRVTGLPHDFILLLDNHLSEDTLNYYLSKVYEYPIPPEPNPLPDESAIEILSIDTIKELGALPYRFYPEESKLEVLVAPPPPGPAEEFKDRLSNILGFDIEVYIVSSMRFQYGLAICYMASDLPNIHIYANGILNGTGDNDNTPPSPVLSQNQGIETQELNLPELKLLPTEGEIPLPSIAIYQTYELLTEMLIEKIDKPIESSKSQIVSKRLKTINIQEFEQKLKTVKNKDEFAEAFERFAASIFKNFALFMCLDGLIVGWRAFGDELTSYDIYGVMLPDDRGSFLSKIYQQNFYLGKPEDTVANKRLLSIFGASKNDIVLGGTIKAGEKTILIVAGVAHSSTVASQMAPILHEGCIKAGETLLSLVKKKSSLKH